MFDSVRAILTQAQLGQPESLRAPLSAGEHNFVCAKTTKKSNGLSSNFVPEIEFFGGICHRIIFDGPSPGWKIQHFLMNKKGNTSPSCWGVQALPEPMVGTSGEVVNFSGRFTPLQQSVSPQILSDPGC